MEKAALIPWYLVHGRLPGSWALAWDTTVPVDREIFAIKKIFVDDLSRRKLNKWIFCMTCGYVLCTIAQCYTNNFFDLYQFLSLSLAMKIRLRENFTSEIFYLRKYPDIRYITTSACTKSSCKQFYAWRDFTTIFMRYLQLVHFEHLGQFSTVPATNLWSAKRFWLLLCLLATPLPLPAAGWSSLPLPIFSVLSFSFLLHWAGRCSWDRVSLCSVVNKKKWDSDTCFNFAIEKSLHTAKILKGVWWLVSQYIISKNWMLAFALRN